MSDALDDDDDVGLRRREQSERDRLAAEEHRADLQWLMQDRRGRRIARWMLGVTQLHARVFVPDAMELSRREGRREVGIEIEDEIREASLEGWLSMLKESGND